MEYQQAKEIADKAIEQLKPHCYRLEIAGSIRRQKPECGDIEIVAIPHPYDIGLFECGIASVVNQWRKVKGELPCKYTQRILPGGIKLDLFFATPENWGLIFAIRTGSADFSKSMAVRWCALGYNSVKGMLTKRDSGFKIVLKEEIDLFKILGWKFIDPKNRI